VTNRLAFISIARPTALLIGTETHAFAIATKASRAAAAKMESATTGHVSSRARHSIFPTALVVAPVRMDLPVTCVKSPSALQIRVKTEEAAR